MGTRIRRALLALSLAGILCGMPAMARAALINFGFPFSVNEGAIPEAGPDTLRADTITGNYIAILSAISSSDSHMFNLSLAWQAILFSLTSYASPGGPTAVPVASQLGSVSPGEYGLYMLFRAPVLMATSASGVTDMHFVFGSEFQLFADPKSDTRFGPPANGASAFLLTGTADDLLLATGLDTFGNGRNDPTLATCDTGDFLDVGCNRFLTQNRIRLTDVGGLYFVSPQPFPGLGLQYAQFAPFAASSNQTINGTMDLTFDGICCAYIPEPPGYALLALGLLGFGLIRRRPAGERSSHLEYWASAPHIESC